jgi:hypothetical protein
MVHKMYLNMLTMGSYRRLYLVDRQVIHLQRAAFSSQENQKVASTVTVIKLAGVHMPKDRCVTHKEYKQAAVLMPNAG